jgi:hypothetical protein
MNLAGTLATLRTSRLGWLAGKGNLYLIWATGLYPSVNHLFFGIGRFSSVLIAADGPVGLRCANHGDEMTLPCNTQHATQTTNTNTNSNSNSRFQGCMHVE